MSKKYFLLLLLACVFFGIIYSMADPTWDALAKNQSDPQLITEYITQAIASHESDPDAHMGSGESIDIHRANSIIDHPPYSVVDDKPKINKFSLLSYFENLLCFQKSGNAFSYLGYMELYTTSTLNNISFIYNPSDDQSGLTPDKTENPIWEVVGFFSATGTYQGYIGIGEMYSDNGVGFEANGTTATAVWYNTSNVKQSISLSGINPKVMHKWRVEIVWGEAIYWFVDNVQVASHSLVSSDIALGGTGEMFIFWVKTTQSTKVAKFLAYRLLYQQDLFAD